MAEHDDAMTRLPPGEQAITDNLEALLAALPPRITQRLDPADRADLLEIVLDLGRRPEARYVGREVFLSDQDVTRVDLEHVAANIGRFGDDNRAGIERTLHRISAIRNRAGAIVGLTCRIGRAVYGTVASVRDLVESGQSILLVGRPGVGKCVTGESLILTSQGLRPLADLIPADLAADQFAPVAVAVHGLNGVEPASHAYRGGLAATLKIVTSQGFTLEGTPEHPVLALTETGNVAFRRLDQLKPGDYVAIQRGQQVFGHDTCLPTFEFRPRTNARDGHVPAELTEDLARFLGYLVAEGTLSFDDLVAFSHTDPEVQAEMVSLTESLFGLRLRRHLHRGLWNGKDFRLFGVKLRRFLAHIGLTYGLAASKRIPPCILAAPKPIVTAFLRALFEGDGSVYGPHGRVEIASASRTLMTQVHVLLLNYGIVGSLRAKYDARYDRHYYALTLIGANVVRFAEEIGFLSTTKRTKLALFAASMKAAGCNPNLDVIPHQNGRLRELRRYVNGSSGALDRFSRADNRAPSYHTAQRILVEARTAVAEAPYQGLLSLVQARFFFDPIKQIEAGEAHVYDLSVPGTHSFFANGFVSHNTTLLREAARVLADDLGKRVVVVDTSNEIAGDGDIPHPGIGRARRMQVPTPTAQHAVMIEAVENHMPEVIVIDEIGTELEAAAARTIAERGVQLIGTAHGNTLANLMLNPTLSDLIGGIQSVTLSDEEARRRGTQKSVLERKAPPSFSVMVEIRSRREVAIHHDVAATVDSILRGVPLPAELRTRLDDGRVVSRQEELDDDAWDEFRQARRTGAALTAARARATRRGGAGVAAHPTLPAEPSQFEAGAGRPGRAEPSAPAAAPTTPPRTVRLYPFGVSRNRLESALRQLNVPAVIVRDGREADAVLTLKNYYRRRPQAVADAEAEGRPIYVLRSNTSAQIEQVLAGIFHLPAPRPGATGEADDHAEAAPSPDRVLTAMQETEEAIQQVMESAQPVELAPQGTYIRRLQHQLAERYNLGSRSRGREPNRRVQIFRGGERL